MKYNRAVVTVQSLPSVIERNVVRVLRVEKNAKNFDLTLNIVS